jgi:hypothetical protein
VGSAVPEGERVTSEEFIYARLDAEVVAATPELGLDDGRGE